MIKSVAAVNPNTIVVMQTMGMVEVEQFKNNVNIPGILWTGYNGQAQGTAIAKILFGDVNPGGKLNVTWHKSVKDLPDFNDYYFEKAPEEKRENIIGISTKMFPTNLVTECHIPISNIAISRSVKTVLPQMIN